MIDLFSLKTNALSQAALLSCLRFMFMLFWRTDESPLITCPMAESLNQEERMHTEGVDVPS